MRSSTSWAKEPISKRILFRDKVLDSPPLWRSTAKDALLGLGAPAVEAFWKLTIEAEEQRASYP